MTIEEAKQTLEKHSPDETSELGEAICIAVKLIDAEIERQSVSDTNNTYSQCDECGQFYLDNRGYDYCPNCGRKLATNDDD